MGAVPLRKVGRTNAPHSEWDAKLLRQKLTAAVEEMQLLDTEIGELRKQVIRYNKIIVEFEGSKGKRGHFKSRFSTILISTMRRLDLNKLSCCISSSSDEEKAVRRLLISTEKRMRRLGKQLTRLRDDASRYRIALAPHKKLPEDVLRYIFTLSCTNAPDTPDTALALSQVCSEWRHIALDMPLLLRQRKESLDQRAISHHLAKFARRQERLSRLYAWRKKFLRVCGYFGRSYHMQR